MLACLTASAQEQPGDKVVYDFHPHFYVQGQFGAQYTLGEISFGKLVSPTAQLGIGYNFTKVFGLRLSANAWQSKGGWDNHSDGNLYKWKWNYVAPQLDLTFNLTNLFFDYNPNRVFNLSLLLGGGANIAWNNDDAIAANASINKIQTLTGNQNLDYVWDGTKVRGFGHAGLAGDFRVSDRVSLGLEVGANVTTDHYNSKKAGNADWYFNALAGIKINLGKTHTKRVLHAPVQPEPRERVVEKVVTKYVDRPAEKAQELRRDIFFKINVSSVASSENSKVQEVVDYLNANPDAKVTVTGYADAGTGNAKINSAIAKKRAEAVTAALKKAGISESRISTDSKGDTVQPFSENDRNRVVIAVAK